MCRCRRRGKPPQTGTTDARVPSGVFPHVNRKIRYFLNGSRHPTQPNYGEIYDAGPIDPTLSNAYGDIPESILPPDPMGSWSSFPKMKLPMVLRQDMAHRSGEYICWRHPPDINASGSDTALDIKRYPIPTELPPELLMMVASYLAPQSIYRLTLTCRRLNQQLGGELWRRGKTTRLSSNPELPQKSNSVVEWAVLNGQHRLAEYYLQNMTPDEVNAVKNAETRYESGWATFPSLLWHAIQGGNVQMVKLLIKYGSEDPSVPKLSAEWQPFNGQLSGLLSSACRVGSLEIVEAVLDAGADINDRNGRTALEQAIHREDPELFKLLWKRGAVPWTPSEQVTAAILFADSPGLIHGLLTRVLKSGQFKTETLASIAREVSSKKCTDCGAHTNPRYCRRLLWLRLSNMISEATGGSRELQNLLGFKALRMKKWETDVDMNLQDDVTDLDGYNIGFEKLTHSTLRSRS